MHWSALGLSPRYTDHQYSWTRVGLLETIAPMEEQAPLSLELRTLKKRQRRLVGGICLVIGLVALGASVVAFLQPGAMMFGIYALAAGVGLTGVGAFTLHKAATSRW